MEFHDVVRRRRVVRNYSGQEVSREALERIIRTALRGPSAGFSQGQSFVVVTDPSIRSEIARLAGEEQYQAMGFDPWLSKAGAIVICCTSERVYRDRYSLPDKLGPGGEQIEWPVPYWFIDGGAALMLLLLATVEEGLAAGFLGMDETAYGQLKELLHIPEAVTPFGIVTIGHPAPDRRSGSLKRGRRPEEQVIHWGRWTGAYPPVQW